ncbi:MAG: hypothetical protein COA79_05995 [Planctomycetota bacterium]|nr:MAG: hypothetical protein COA79_05995 [Planctomycetota bacterium]
MIRKCKSYLLGSSEESIEWPYWVHYIPANVKKPFSMSEGLGHASAGNYFSAQELLDDNWKDHLSITNCLWLSDLLINSSDLNQISEKIVLNHYGDLPLFHEIDVDSHYIYFQPRKVK